VQQNLATV
jgi:hypothetical protein